MLHGCHEVAAAWACGGMWRWDVVVACGGGTLGWHVAVACRQDKTLVIVSHYTSLFRFYCTCFVILAPRASSTIVRLCKIKSQW